MKPHIKQSATIASSVKSVYKNGDTPLHRAAKRNNTKSITTLLKAKADVNRRNRSDKTPLHFAAAKGTTKTIKALLNAKADITATTIHHTTALCFAASRAGKRGAIATKCLLDAKADVNAVNKKGETALHRALNRASDSPSNNFHTIKTLLNRGSDVNHLDNSGHSPLEVAVIVATLTGNWMFALLLIDHGASVNARSGRGVTPLGMAARIDQIVSRQGCKRGWWRSERLRLHAAGERREHLRQFASDPIKTLASVG